MNFDPAVPEEMNFEPNNLSPLPELPQSSDVVASFLAEASIVRTIVLGSGGPENAEITDTGLRFVRHLMATSKSMRFGFMPNFKDMNSIRETAREFIRKCGGSNLALQQMHSLMQEG